jgi:hypothetical protein
MNYSDAFHDPVIVNGVYYCLVRVYHLMRNAYLFFQVLWENSQKQTPRTPRERLAIIDSQPGYLYGKPMRVEDFITHLIGVNRLSRSVDRPASSSTKARGIVQ